MTQKTTAKKRALLRRVNERKILRPLGREMKRLRQELGLNQIELSQTAGLSENVAGGIERGTYNPSVVVLYMIAARLGVKLSAVFAAIEGGESAKRS